MDFKEEMQKLGLETLVSYVSPVRPAAYPIEGRNEEMMSILATFARKVVTNAILLGAPGTGKTAIVQGLARSDKRRIYLEVDLSLMATGENGSLEMAARLKQLFDEVEQYKQYMAENSETAKEIVLFIDEFHRIIDMSATATEEIKPALAESGVRGIKILAATTFEEYEEKVAKNKALNDRLERVTIRELNKENVVKILYNLVRKHLTEEEVLAIDPKLFELVYEYTNRYNPSSPQPRKSILLVDRMLGYHSAFNKALDEDLLAAVLYSGTGVNVKFQADAKMIKTRLDKRVFSQQFATSVLEKRLQICVSNLNDPSRPMSSFLFTGSTGVGKGLTNDTRIPVYDENGEIAFKRNGDLQIGDYVFNRLGKPVQVVGVFPRGMMDIYKVSLSDGRYLYTDSSHLWTYMLNKGKQTSNTYTNSTKELLERGVYTEAPDGRRRYKYWIPMNNAVAYPRRNLSVDPYVFGAFLGDGCMTLPTLTFSSSDDELVENIAELLGDCKPYKVPSKNYSWQFLLNESDGRIKYKQTNVVFKDYLSCCSKANEKFIPDDYKYSSIEQRWSLIQGLFDTDGSISGDSRYNISFSSTSLQLIKDIQEVLYSLGVSSRYSVSRNIEQSNGNYIQYTLRVKISHSEKYRFFKLSRKVAIANDAKKNIERLSRKKDYNYLAIVDIEKMNYQKETTCIYVDDEEHLYQAGDYVVTHNTEMAKGMSDLLFGDERALIRFDMSEFATLDAIDRFRDRLTGAVWSKPYGIILLDEIEKAEASVTRLLLQVLDDGRLSDRYGREVSFKNTYIIMTTNVASEVYKEIGNYASSDDGAEGMTEYHKVIRRALISSESFPSELINRIDVIVPFQPLSNETLQKIISIKLIGLQRRVMKEHHVEVSIDKDVVKYLCMDKYDSDTDSGGARGIVHQMDLEVTTKIAEVINADPKVRRLYVYIDGTLAADDKFRRLGTASVKVRKGSSTVR